MELVASIAIGLNPFVGVFAASSFAAFSDRWTASGPLCLLIALAVAAGAAVPVHLAVAYLPRYTARVRRVVQLVAPVAGAVGVAHATETDLPLLLAALVGAVGASAVAWLVTTAARRASRLPAWVGLGHIPVLMGVTTLSACLVPLAVALPEAAALASALAECAEAFPDHGYTTWVELAGGRIVVAESTASGAPFQKSQLHAYYFGVADI